VAVDFDDLVNAVVVSTFGVKTQTGATATYTPKGGTAFPLDGVYDEAWREVDISRAGRGMGFAVSTTRPAFGCRLSQFPSGVAPAQGDTLTLSADIATEGGSPISDESGDGLGLETQFTVADVRPDGISGWVLLILN
jgi:hypothetical protein